jgi:hypothetical protein
MTPDRRYTPPRPVLSPEQVTLLLDLLRRLVEAMEKGKP